MGKFKKRLIILGSVGIVIAGCLTYNLLNKPTDLENYENKKEMIAMYIQDEEGNYQTSSAKEFPKEGYVLNIEKSTCKNGGILSQDPTTKAINLKVSHADACNLYFDKDVPKITTGGEALEYLNIKVNPSNKRRDLRPQRRQMRRQMDCSAWPMTMGRVTTIEEQHQITTSNSEKMRVAKICGGE